MSAWQLWAYFGLYPAAGSDGVCLCMCVHSASCAAFVFSSLSTSSSDVAAAVVVAGAVVVSGCCVVLLCCAVYILGSPGLPSANMTVPEHSPTAPYLTMIAHDWSPEAVYVAEVRINGQPQTTSFVRHATVFSQPFGNVLEFFMATTAQTE